MAYIKNLKEIQLKTIAIEMMQLKKDHDVAIDPRQKELILMKWNNKAKEYANIIDNEIERKK
ncbi:hypothetical protein Lederberg_34 [Pelagibacter phage Lederberg EXVC029P]|nr:hypothetical protein Lederberg_34 [Pelagibacter phage Lederberg EXVC029P]